MSQTFSVKWLGMINTYLYSMIIVTTRYSTVAYHHNTELLLHTLFTEFYFKLKDPVCFAPVLITYNK